MDNNSYKLEAKKVLFKEGIKNDVDLIIETISTQLRFLAIKKNDLTRANYSALELVY